MPPPANDEMAATKLGQPFWLPESLCGEVCKFLKIPTEVKRRDGSRERTTEQRSLVTYGKDLANLRRPARLPPTAYAPVTKDLEDPRTIPLEGASPGSKSNNLRRELRGTEPPSLASMA